MKKELSLPSDLSFSTFERALVEFKQHYGFCPELVILSVALNINMDATTLARRINGGFDSYRDKLPYSPIRVVVIIGEELKDDEWKFMGIKGDELYQIYSRGA